MHVRSPAAPTRSALVSPTVPTVPTVRRALGRLTALACCLLSASPLRADTPADGFALTPLPYPGGIATATLGGGDVIAFDGLSVTRHDASGQLLQTLASLGSFVFPSFLLVDPAEDFVVAGESTHGDIFRVELTGGLTGIVNLPFNYDAAFEDAGHLLVSAAPTSMTNRVLRLELASGLLTPLVEVQGASGPVVLDLAGDLVYATSSAQFPAPLGSTDVLRWPRALLTGAVLLDESDACVVASGFDGGGDLVLDPRSGELYLAENNFGTGQNRVRRVGTGPLDSPIVVDGAPFDAIHNLEFAPGAGPAPFRGFQPAGGGTLRYNATDFFSVFARFALEPLRAGAAVSGPGVSGVGPFDLTVDAGPQNGFGIVLYGPSALFGPGEYAFFLPAAVAPLFTGLDPGTARVHPQALGLDASGHGALSFLNSSGMTGFLAAQVLLIDQQLAIVGTSSAAFL